MARRAKQKANQNPYQEMKGKLQKAMGKFHKDIGRKAPQKTIQKDASELILLLGEVNYLSREAWRMERDLRQKW